MHLYNTNYGQGSSSSTPQFSVRGNSIYLTSHNKSLQTNNRSAAMYQMVGNKIYQTAFHPDGKSLHPVYEVKRGSVYRTINHKEGHSSQAEFKMIDPSKRFSVAPRPIQKAAPAPKSVIRPSVAPKPPTRK